MAAAPPRCPVLGVGISAVSLEDATTRVLEWVHSGSRQYVCVTGMHGVIECQKDAELKRVHNGAGMVTPDGMPMVWLGRLAGFRNITRVYGPDLMLEVCRASAGSGVRHYFYGGGQGVARKLARQMKDRFPGLMVVGTSTPPFGAPSAQQEQQIIEQLNASSADVIWVGLSTPRQERWMARVRAKLHAPVLLGVGAAFDFNAGIKRQAPRWMQRAGLEWLFRLCSEPRRLWRRYLTGIPLFGWYLVLERLGMRDFDLPDDEYDGVVQA